jgi:hypothetical protein
MVSESFSAPVNYPALKDGVSRGETDDASSALPLLNDNRF